MFKNLFSSMTLTWLARRALELGGTWLVTNGFITEDQTSTTLGALSVVGGLIWNVVSSFSPHVVSAGKKMPLNELGTATRATVKAAVARKPTLIERLTGKQ